MATLPHGCRVALRALALGCALQAGCTLALPAAAGARKLTAANWDLSAQHLVEGDAVMGALGGAGFAGARPLSASGESAALTALATRESVAPVALAAGQPLTVVRFDALLVDQLGLGDVAAHVQQVAGAAGLAPPSYFGTEVVARYLGLRYNHPTGEDGLELYPWNTVTRAEAAHSFAVVLGFLPPPPVIPPASGETPPTPSAGGETPATPPASSETPSASGEAAQGSTPAPAAPAPEPSWQLVAARETLMGFALPAYTPAQRRVLRIAVAKIGMPYVWGGTTDNRADGLEHGGYDCSGFAWRVYKVSGLSWGRRILGRTAAQQAGEIPRRQRIPLQDVQGGDLLFFGSAGFHSAATESSVIHEGIALSDQWAIHSSDQGVYVLPLTSGWLAQSFAWARRVL